MTMLDGQEIYCKSLGAEILREHGMRLFLIFTDSILVHIE